jgi:unsaturated rhamnogalacturonyl hydrolase
MTGNGRPSLDPQAVTGTPVDWSVAMVDSTMSRYTPTSLGDWTYTRALYLYGQYRVYERTRDARYLAYVRSWVDRFVPADGSITVTVNDLDSMLAGRLLVALHRETGDARYRKAATAIVNRLATYPRTTDLGFWHKTGYSNQLWADGAYMVNPFLAEHGRQFDDTAAFDEAARQLEVYAGHLQQPSGVIRHGYDQTKTTSWADKTTGVSPEAWGRADGWFAMALVDVLEALPADHPRRPALVAILRKLLAAVKANQDPVTGRWFEVLDKGSRSDNWTETSCSAMFAYAVSRAVQRRYVDPSYAAVATRGYAGVLTQVSTGSDGLTDITNTVTGAAPDVYSYYVGRTRATNDFHGLGAFLIMSEQLAGTAA